MELRYSFAIDMLQMPVQDAVSRPVRWGCFGAQDAAVLALRNQWLKPVETWAWSYVDAYSALHMEMSWKFCWFCCDTWMHGWMESKGIHWSLQHSQQICPCSHFIQNKEESKTVLLIDVRCLVRCDKKYWSCRKLKLIIEEWNKHWEVF